MVGFTAEELLSGAEPPARRPPFRHWPPEHAAFTPKRQRARLAGMGRDAREARRLRDRVHAQGGERFPVMIYEAPLVDARAARAAG